MTNKNTTNSNKIDDLADKLSKTLYPHSVNRLPDGISINKRDDENTDSRDVVISETEDGATIESDFAKITITHSGISIKLKDE